MKFSNQSRAELKYNVHGSRYNNIPNRNQQICSLLSFKSSRIRKKRCYISSPYRFNPFRTSQGQPTESSIFQSFCFGWFESSFPCLFDSKSGIRLFKRNSIDCGPFNWANLAYKFPNQSPLLIKRPNCHCQRLGSLVPS